MDAVNRAVRWASLIVFFGSALMGRWTITLVSCLILLFFLGVDVFVRIGSPSGMKDLMQNLAWGALGGATFSILSIGYPLLFLAIFKNWSPGISRQALQVLFYAPGPILGIAAWVAIIRYSGRRSKSFPIELKRGR